MQYAPRRGRRLSFRRSTKHVAGHGSVERPAPRRPPPPRGGGRTAPAGPRPPAPPRRAGGGRGGHPPPPRGLCPRPPAAIEEHHEHRYVGAEKQAPIVTRGSINDAIHAVEIKLRGGWFDSVCSWENTR